MRINRTVATAVCIAMLAFTFLACEDDEIKSVKIGNQTWMAENLNIAIDGSVCYENKTENCEKYGRMYNWETAINICPKGWHLPTVAEWDELVRYADGASGGAESPYKSQTAGKFLQAKSGWNNNGNGEDKFGFAALPGGSKDSKGFGLAGDYGVWWSASEVDANGAYNRIIAKENVVGINFNKSALLSVRCIKGNAKPTATEQAKASEQPKKPTTKNSSPEEVASLYIVAAFKMDIETMKKITTGQMLEKILATESILRMKASSDGKSYEEFRKELQSELASKGELVIKSSTKVSDDGEFARVIVYAGKKGDDLELPTAIVLAKQGGNWKVFDTPK
ncbi:MAG: fibrobacter succinogenes major paralogous domain-containing protein [Fibromonadaceae bacterium]|jgi:uncharacterized protein (TIGR02145 family)|nr:fibrobacter succinogenes major paralogous domain-containing protein [Fibromonadaceae bacterium]